MRNSSSKKLSKRDAAFLNKLELTSEVEEALLNEWPVLEDLLNRKLTLKEAYGIAFDRKDDEE